MPIRSSYLQLVSIASIYQYLQPVLTAPDVNQRNQHEQDLHM
ncbi:hypothetical protein [Shewanella baltica]|nr:hypothetical protein [Shewanella baltica]